MSQPNQLLLLNNAMDYIIDVYFMTLKLKNSRRVAINISNISYIKLGYTIYDKVNLSYYEISMINGEKYYVNKMNALRLGLFNVSYTINEDYVKVETFIDNCIVANM